MLNMFNCYALAHDHQNRNRPSAEKPTVVSPESAFKNFLKEINSIDKKNELEKYLDEPNFDDDGNFDLLLWWKENSLKYPVLSKMARDVFATPVLTVASESAFSTGGRIFDSFRSCLNPKMAEALFCAQDWLRPSLNQLKDQIIQEDLEASENI
ncbi:zinc finger BED domain-containing protein ricesleeper 1-like, partial [Trifolium medium]|nr:zinc finger BED domain-containing protein ricesleeper 1-like [Trifolium medium]